MAYEWDPKKAASNLRKHKVDFADAVAVFEDDSAVTINDDDESEEKRFVTIGMDALARIVVVVYAWRGNNIRIISARKAGAEERRQYEEGL